MKKIFFWTVLFIAGITIPLLMLEVAGRTYMAVTHGVEGKSYGLWRYDSVIGAVHRENAYNSNASTNDFGFRNAEAVLNPKPLGSKRIIAYGGSTTFCYNLLNEQTWPLRLQALLRQRPESTATPYGANTQDQVLNAGAILWSIGHAYARAQRDIPTLKPDYVIIYSGINEETNDEFLRQAGTPLDRYVANKEYGEFATNLDQNRWSKRNLFVVRIFDYVIKPLLEKVELGPKNQTSENDTSELITDNSATEVNEVVQENYQQVLIAFLELIKANGAQPIFVAQAYGIDSPRNKRFTAYSQAAIEIAGKHGAITLNAQDMVDSYDGSSQDLFSSSGVHYSEYGAIKLAEFIQDAVFVTTQ